MKILSFNPCLEAETNRLCIGRAPDRGDLEAIRNADAVILPQGCKKELYFMARENCPNVFPNYDAFYGYPGKTGQIELFERTGVAFPHSVIFPDVASFRRSWQGPPVPLPCVFKFSWGGEGKFVFFLESHEDFLHCMEKAETWEEKGLRGFLFQEYVPTGGKSLRVVVMGRHIYSYWRVQQGKEKFYTNLSKGASIDRDSYPELQQKGGNAVRLFSCKTGINLAGLDFLFDVDSEKPVPLFLEINYYFRYRGLGTPDTYFKLLEEAVLDWLETLT